MLVELTKHSMDFDHPSRRETPISRNDIYHLSTIYLDAFLHSQSSDEQYCLVLQDNSITIESYGPLRQPNANLSDFRYVAQYERSKSQPYLIQPLAQQVLQPLIRALEVSGDDDDFCFDTKAVTRKMPSMQALDMFGCDCRHLAEHIGLICDLSYLRQLSLGGTNLSEGLKNLPVFQLANLQVLHLYADDDTESEDFLSVVGELLGELKSLEIFRLLWGREDQFDPSNMFKKVGLRLRRLSFSMSSPTISGMDEIFADCGGLLDLELDLNLWNATVCAPSWTIMSNLTLYLISV